MKDPLAAKFGSKAQRWVAVTFIAMSIIEFFTHKWATEKAGVALDIDPTNFFVQKFIALCVFSFLTYWVVYFSAKLLLHLSREK